jgi:hypothetical protein
VATDNIRSTCKTSLLFFPFPLFILNGKFNLAADIGTDDLSSEQRTRHVVKATVAMGTQQLDNNTIAEFGDRTVCCLFAKQPAKEDEAKLCPSFQPASKMSSQCHNRTDACLLSFWQA